MKTYVLGNEKCLSAAFLMSTSIICSYRELEKIVPELLLKSLLNNFSAYICKQKGALLNIEMP